MIINSINVYDSVLPVFLCSKIFGLCPFSISKKGCTKTLTSIIFPFTMAILFTAHSLSELYMRENREELLIYTLTDYFHTFAGVFSAISIYLLSILLRNMVRTEIGIILMILLFNLKFITLTR